MFLPYHSNPFILSALMLYCFVVNADSHPKAQNPLAISSDLVVVEGVAVPDIGPLVPSAHGSDTEELKAKVQLGKQLYFDGRLSRDNQVSCAYCHIPGAGFADPHPTSTGIGDQLGGRQAPTILNAALNPLQFWDGRATSLEEQALGPIQNPIEMGETAEHVAAKLQDVPGYRRQFKEVFGGDVSLPRITEAIAAFERTLVSTNSAFDKYVSGDSKAMSETAIHGLRLFKGKARCILCHNGLNFTDNQFHNLGVPQVGPQKEDLGRYEVTKHDRDRGAFKTPTLRSVVETAPYMHDGAFLTLEDVVEFLNRGGGANPHLSPLIRPLALTEGEKHALVAFLEALTGDSPKVDAPSLP